MNRGVIFDIDGTLVDSNYQHALAWFRTFAEVGEQVPMYRIHRAIGMGSQQLIKGVLGRDEPQLSERHSSGRCRLRCIALLTGGTGQCELEVAGAAQVFATPADVLARLDSSLIGRVLTGGGVA